LIHQAPTLEKKIKDKKKRWIPAKTGMTEREAGMAEKKRRFQ